MKKERTEKERTVWSERCAQRIKVEIDLQDIDYLCSTYLEYMLSVGHINIHIDKPILEHMELKWSKFHNLRRYFQYESKFWLERSMEWDEAIRRDDLKYARLERARIKKEKKRILKETYQVTK